MKNKIIVLWYKRMDLYWIVDDNIMHYDCIEEYSWMDRNSCMDRFWLLFSQLHCSSWVFFNPLFYVLDLMVNNKKISVDYNMAIYRLNRYFEIYKNIIILYKDDGKYKHILDKIWCNKIKINKPEDIRYYIN